MGPAGGPRRSCTMGGQRRAGAPSHSSAILMMVFCSAGSLTDTEIL